MKHNEIENLSCQREQTEKINGHKNSCEWYKHGFVQNYFLNQERIDSILLRNKSESLSTTVNLQRVRTIWQWAQEQSSFCMDAQTIPLRAASSFVSALFIMHRSAERRKDPMHQLPPLQLSISRGIPSLSLSFCTVLGNRSNYPAVLPAVPKSKAFLLS